MTHDPDFKGYIHDVGGPTANFRQPSCQQTAGEGSLPATGSACFPLPVPNLKADHRDYVALLQEAESASPDVKKVFIRSGIRFDYLLADPDDTFLRELCQYHVSGQLKVAPEHVSDAVLEQDGKTGQPGLSRRLCADIRR